jgi:hypothetical protein
MAKNQMASLAIPANCSVAMVRLIVAGGSGQSASTIVIGDGELKTRSRL